MAVSANELTKDLIAYTMATDKQSIKSLLRKNGVTIPSDATDQNIIMATLIASNRSPVFKSELTALLTKSGVELQKGYMQFAGNQFEIGTETDKMMFTGESGFFNQIGGTFTPQFGQAISSAADYAAAQKKTTPATTTKTKEKGKFFSWLKDNVLTSENINAGVQIGLTAINNKVQQKSNQAQLEAADIAQKQQEVILAQGGQKAAKFNVTTLALVVVGVAILGGVIYYVAKK